MLTSPRSKYFRESISLSKLFPSIPAEQARTQFMLAKALKMGGIPIEPEEEMQAGQMVTKLMQTYYASVGQVAPRLFSEASDFNLFISSKYQ